MADLIVIYDAVSWTTGSPRDNDLEYHVLTRGQEVPADVPAEKVEAWQDPERFGPYGAVAQAGSQLAELGSSGVSVAADPDEARRRFRSAAEESPDEFVTPAREPVDGERTDVDPGVARSREVGAVSAATREALDKSAGITTGRQSVDDMSVSELRDMAEGLGIDGADSMKKAELKEAIQAHVGSGSEPQYRQPSE